MEWREWAQVDAAIRAEFGYRAEDDRAAAAALREHVAPGHRLRDLHALMRGREVCILGCGPSLAEADAGRLGRVVVAADGAVSWLREQGRAPDAVVTDLDGDPEDLAWAARQGATMVVHAHGDNRGAVAELAPFFGPRLYGTYQGPPAPGLAPLANPGGFTDGDRALVLAEHLGARRARLVGFDFDQPPSRYSHRFDPATKPRKLDWARRIVDAVAERGRIQVTLG